MLCLLLFVKGGGWGELLIVYRLHVVAVGGFHSVFLNVTQAVIKRVSTKAETKRLRGEPTF